MNSESPLSFPCSFPVKVMGKNEPAFEELAFAIVKTHVPEHALDEVKRQLSRDGNYLSLTFRFEATSRAQLDALYMELSANEHVLVAL
jgi:putative lipoic acid-binding regulatory protein